MLSARGEGECRPSHWSGPEDEDCVPAHQPADELLSVGLTHGVTATDVLMDLSGDETINPRLPGFANVISGSQELLLTNTLCLFMCSLLCLSDTLFWMSLWIAADAYIHDEVLHMYEIPIIIFLQVTFLISQARCL